MHAVAQVDGSYARSRGVRSSNTAVAHIAKQLNRDLGDDHSEHAHTHKHTHSDAKTPHQLAANVLTMPSVQMATQSCRMPCFILKAYENHLHHQQWI